MLPAMSLPTPIGDTLDAIAAPSPPELPPADFLWFQGFRVLPHRKLKESKLKASWGRFVLMKGIWPVFFRHFMVAQSSLKGFSALTVIPTVEQVPCMSMLSLMEVGIPKRGGRNLSISQSSSRVQFFLPESCLSLSHSLALVRAKSKYYSVIMQLLTPIVQALSA